MAKFKRISKDTGYLQDGDNEHYVREVKDESGETYFEEIDEVNMSPEQ